MIRNVSLVFRRVSKIKNHLYQMIEVVDHLFFFRNFYVKQNNYRGRQGKTEEGSFHEDLMPSGCVKTLLIPEQ